MSASTAGAIKAYLEAQGLGVAVFRDRPPTDDEPLPYVSVSEALTLSPAGAFNAFDDPEGHVAELVQVDLWQQWKDIETRTVLEDYALADDVYRALHAARLSTAPTKVDGVRVTSMNRIVEVERNIVHHAITVQIDRVLERVGS